MAGHVSPEASRGGPLALVRDGDMVALDIPGRRLDVEVPEAELQQRKAAWVGPAPRYTTGVLGEVRAAGVVGVDRSGNGMNVERNGLQALGFGPRQGQKSKAWSLEPMRMTCH